MANEVQLVTERSSAGLCEALFTEFDMLRNGKSDAARASAVAKLAIQIIATKRLEIDAAQILKGSIEVRAVMFKDGLKIGGKSAARK